MTVATWHLVIITAFHLITSVVIISDHYSVNILFKESELKKSSSIKALLKVDMAIFLEKNHMGLKDVACVEQ